MTKRRERTLSTSRASPSLASPNGKRATPAGHARRMSKVRQRWLLGGVVGGVVAAAILGGTGWRLRVRSPAPPGVTPTGAGTRLLSPPGVGEALSAEEVTLERAATRK